jgi:hypothetical protein
MATQYVCQIVIKGNTIFHSKGFRNVPKLVIGFENKTSGNPGVDSAGAFGEIYLLMPLFMF